MRKLILYPLILLAGLLVGLFLSDGSVWTLVAGPPDLGRADYARTDRPMNEFVACVANDPACPEPSLVIARPAAQPESVLGAIAEVAMQQSRVERVDDGSDPLHRRYVARSAFFKFPDTVSINAAPLNGGTALRVSSRSQIGVDDLGANERRVRLWLAQANVRPAG